MSKDDQPLWKFGKDFPRGTLLFPEGDPGEVIEKGNLEITVKMLKKIASRLRNLDEHLETVLLGFPKERK